MNEHNLLNVTSSNCKLLYIMMRIYVFKYTISSGLKINMLILKYAISSGILRAACKEQ